MFNSKIKKFFFTKGLLKEKTSLKRIFFIFFLLLVFFLTFRPSTDPDLGWHLKTGELILERGIPKTDWYSYTMPDYPWIAHEWLSDVITYQIFSVTGLLGLSFFFSLFLTIIFIILYSALPRDIDKEIKIFLILAAILVSAPVIFGGARMQYVTLMGFALLTYFLVKWRAGKISTKKLYWLPFIFIIWANLHGGFIVGLVLLFLFILLEWIRFLLKKKDFVFSQDNISLSFHDLKKATIFFFVSLAATLINPYLYRIYTEIYNTFTDRDAFNNIAEFLSPNFHSPQFLNFLIYLLAIFVLVIIYRKTPDFTLGILTLLFLAMSFRSIRNIPIFTILATLFIVPYIIPFWSAIKKHFRYASAFFFFALIGFFLVVSFFRIFGTIGASFWKELYGVESGYPTVVAEHLKKHPLTGKVFNRYSWGGYLLYEGVADKVFIDGRMAIWKKEGECVFCDYLKIKKIEPGWKKKLDKYKVDWIIIDRNSSLDGALQEDSDWEVYAADLYGIVYKRKK